MDAPDKKKKKKKRDDDAADKMAVEEEQERLRCAPQPHCASMPLVALTVAQSDDLTVNVAASKRLKMGYAAPLDAELYREFKVPRPPLDPNS